ncbi:MAG: hypothetical protein JXB17_00975 [Bacteroidales bacterium]|nr:hypothetical protein [Bacteroidales bacterium]
MGYTLCIPIIGSLLAYAYQYSGIELSPILSINIGASAPLILKSFAKVVPQTDPDKID